MVLLILTSVLLILILIASAIKPVPNPIRPRCIKRSYDTFTNTNLYLVHDVEDWQQNQLDALEEIATKYNQCTIELTMFRSEQIAPINNISSVKKSSVNSSRFGDLKMSPPMYGPQILPRKKRQVVKDKDESNHLLKDKTNDEIDLNINIGAKNLLKAFLERRRIKNSRKSFTQISPTATTAPPIRTINNLTAKFPRIVVRNVTKRNFFEETPLHATWKNLNDNALIFAVRVLKLWENGGISFELPESVYVKPTATNISERQTLSLENSSTAQHVARTLSPIDENKIIKNMIDIGYTSFKNLPEGLVTVDEEGVHMETKTTCHAFFGEALVQLQAATNRTSIPEVIRITLKTFCERGAVDSDYCNSIQT